MHGHLVEHPPSAIIKSKVYQLSLIIEAEVKIKPFKFSRLAIKFFTFKADTTTSTYQELPVIFQRLGSSGNLNGK